MQSLTPSRTPMSSGPSVSLDMYLAYCYFPSPEKSEKSFPSTSHRAGLWITFLVTASLKIYLFGFHSILVLVIEFWFDRIFLRC